MFCGFFFVAVLREEDYPDKPNEYIESCIGMSEPVAKVCQLLLLLAVMNCFVMVFRTYCFQVLRMMCLQSVVNNGLKPKLLEYYKREILQVCNYCQCL